MGIMSRVYVVFLKILRRWLYILVVFAISMGFGYTGVVSQSIDSRLADWRPARIN